MPNPITRRQAMTIGAGATVLPLVHIRSGRAAGRLSVAFADHWVPGGNAIMRKQCAAWAANNQVEVQTDFVTSMGHKNVLTIAAEAEARSGHDIRHFPQWDVHNHASRLEPIDDVMGRLTAKYGAANKVGEYLARIGDHWMAVPSSTGSRNRPPFARISMMKQLAGLDVTKMYPVSDTASPESADWNWDYFLKLAESCRKAGRGFAIGLSATPDCEDFAGAFLSSFGADLVDMKGNVLLESDGVRQAMEYAQRLVKFLPGDAASFDDASNNRALIGGRTALIFDPPSAWVVAKKTAPAIAADCWTMSAPRGPKGRFIPYEAFFLGVWNFSPNKTAAKELIEYLSQREQVEQRCNAVDGYDIPPFQSMTDFNIWRDAAPPKGAVYNYPIRPSHHAQPNISGMSAAPEVAVQMYNQGTHAALLAKLQAGQSVKQALDWARNELEGFLA